MKALTPGQEIETSVTAISGNCVFLDLNSKSEGILDIAEVTDEKGNISLKEGDVIKAYFIGYKNGEMLFTAKIRGDIADKNILKTAFENRIPVEGTVEKEIKGGYRIKLGKSQAFCPYSQMDYGKKEKPEFYIGKNLSFRIQEYTQEGQNIIVSNREILEEEHKKHIEELKKTLKKGMAVEGIVESLHSFGAFVTIQGFKALLPISEISRDRIEDISSHLSPGQKIKVKIISDDWEHERISVSLKALQADPWEKAEEKYPVDSKHTGSISRIANFGIFVRLESGIEGLVHISEIENAEGNTNLKKMFDLGTKMSVVVKEINAEKRRISLKPAPSDEEEEAAKKYLDGQDSGETYNPFAGLLKKK